VSVTDYWRRKNVGWGLAFYASVVEWLLRCGRCMQKMEGNEYKLERAGFNQIK